MAVLPYWITSQIPYYKELENTAAEEIRKIKEKADRYDKLVSLVGYQEVMDVMRVKVDAEISEATKYNLEPEKQRIHVIRWNAMREVLDSAINEVNDIRRERDRINKEEAEFLRKPKYSYGEEVNA